MGDARKSDPPTKPTSPPPTKPTKKASPHGTTAATSAEVAGNMPHFTIGELVDLALSTPEVGAVNFNILRLLLRELVDKSGVDKQPARMTDLEAHQVDNFKNYVHGSTVASPMPGVLKIAPHGPGGGGMGMAYGVKPGSMTSPDSNKALIGGSTPRSPKSGHPPTGEVVASLGDIPEKVARLEKHLEALYQLPGNAEILDRAKANEMSVNDMWQIIQLNNRIAAAEAAIQKMASLIEDLARSMNRVKGDTKTIKRSTEELTATNSDLQLQGQNLKDKNQEFWAVIKALRDDMHKLKKGWKMDRALLEKTLGVDLGRVPSFMKLRQDAGTTGTGADDDSAEQSDRGTQTFVLLKDNEKQQHAQPPRPPPKPQTQHRDHRDQPQPPQQRRPKKAVEDMIPLETIATMSPEEIAKQVTVEELLKIPPEVFKQMSPEQKKVLRDIHKSAQQLKPKPKPSLGVKNMTAEELENLDPERIAEHMSYEEAVNLAPEILAKMSDKQREAVQRVIKNGEGKAKQQKKTSHGVKHPLGVASMNAEQLAAISPATISSKMHYDEAVKIPQDVLDRMTAEQRDAVRKTINAGRLPSDESLEGEGGADDDDFSNVLDGQQKSRKTKPLTAEELDDIAKIAPEDLAASISPEMALAIPSDELRRRFTPAQIQEIQRLKSIAPHHEESDEFPPEHVEEMSPSELVGTLTDHQLLEITSEQLNVLSPDQQVAVKDAIRKSRIAHAAADEEEGEGQGEEEDEAPPTDVEEEVYDDNESDSGRHRKSHKDRQKHLPQRQHRSGTHHKHHHQHHHHGSTRVSGHQPHVEIADDQITTLGEPLPPMSLEEYLASLPPEEAANLAADAVQRELQKQYGQLQGMQRQLAQDIQGKMEFIYQRLLQEIATQQITTSPYMAVGEDEQCLGPGICTGHGMPAGIAVVQFPDVRKEKVQALVPAGYAIAGGVDIVPADDKPVSAEAQVALQALKAPEKKEGEIVGLGPRGVGQRQGAGLPLSEMDEALLREMKSLMILDLEKIREEMRHKKFGAFDEKDMIERLGAVWEAIKILKHNEEALAIKIATVDAVLKKLPIRLLEKLSKIPEETFDAMAAGHFPRAMYHSDGSPLTRHDEDRPNSPKKSIGTAADKGDIQTLFNNLANVIAECTEQKDRIDQIADTTRIMESGMVTKQMLLDSLSDKADKGLINTKVSYDEFGSTVDELHIQLHNLMAEGFQRNENWKKVTAGLAEDLAEKLDKVELAPIRSFFKSHMKTLEDKVATLWRLVEEPDPAGTRKRLLRDFNCLSCDRIVNISGVTNGPTLPTIGPIHAGHTTASRRALDLSRMRIRKQFDANTKNLNALERQNRGQGKCRVPDPNQLACDMDVMNVVNRYTGGSHTAINTADRIATKRRSGGGCGLQSMANPVPAPIMSGGGRAPPMANTPGGGDAIAAAGRKLVDG